MSSAHRPGETRKLSRRNVLLGAATVGVGGAVAGVAGLSQAFEDAPEANDQAIVIHVIDLNAGRLDVFVNEQRIEITDADLGQRLSKYAR